MKRLCRRTALVMAFVITALVGIGDASAQYCVRYARSLTDFDIRGNAWTWWQGAEGRYERGHEPMEGAVLVFRRGYGGMRLGHVSTVTGQVDARTILVTHSFGGPVLWRDVPVIDISANNDWSRVRVWSGPANVMGTTEFGTYGFVYPVAYGAMTGIPRRFSRTGPRWALLESVPLPPRRPANRLSGASGDMPATRPANRPRWEDAEAFDPDNRQRRLRYTGG